MSKLTDFFSAGELMRSSAERLLARWKHEVMQRKAGAGERLGADLQALVRPYVSDDSVAEYLAFMLNVALVQDANVQLMYPLTVTGVVFKRGGRKKGSLGPVRGWIRKYVARHPEAMPAQAWAAFAKRPPKGCTPYSDHVWVEGAGATSRAWFGSMVSEEKKAHLQGLANP